MRQSLNVAGGVTAATSVEAMERGRIIEDALQTLSDGVEGYRTVADQVESTALESMLRSLAEERKEAAELVLRTAADAGIEFEPETDGSVTGAAHRVWLKIESAVAGDDALIGSAKNAEEHAISDLEDALEIVTSEELAGSLRSALSSVREAKQKLVDWQAENRSS